MGGGSGSGGGCWSTTGLPSGTVTAQQKRTLASIAEEEKLAHDLYQAFANKYPAVIFDRIATAEAGHLDAVRTLVSRYSIADPTAGKASGTFASGDVQATYSRLLAKGSASQAAALAVGQDVEKADIAALERALDGLTAPDVRQVYQHLLMSSRHHLSAFTTWSGR
jgi:hypothetical protein